MLLLPCREHRGVISTQQRLATNIVTNKFLNCKVSRWLLFYQIFRVFSSLIGVARPRLIFIDSELANNNCYSFQPMETTITGLYKVRTTINKMEPSDVFHFPIEKMEAVRNAASNLGLQYDKKFRTMTDT